MKKSATFFLCWLFRRNFQLQRNFSLYETCTECQSNETKFKPFETNSSKLFDGKLEDIIKYMSFMGAKFDDFDKKKKILYQMK